MKFTTPETVAEAITPFEKVKENLKAVLAAQATNRSAAQGRLETARKSAEKAEKTETAKIKAAQEEELRAKALIARLEALLIADVPVNIDNMSPAQKVNAGKKLNR